MTSGSKYARAALRCALNVASLLCALALLFALAAPLRAQQTEKAKVLGKRMKCMCGCNQILTECNHVGCKVSAQMLKELDERVGRNEPDDLMIQSFVQEYGTQVLVLPPVKGFNLTAWIMPAVVPLVGLVLVWMAVTKWRHRAATASAAKISPELLARARQESERGGED